MTVTGHTGSDYVFPCMFASLETRYDMINSKLTFFAAILAGEVIPVENCYAGEFSFCSRSPDNIIQFYYGWNSIGCGRGMDVTASISSISALPAMIRASALLAWQILRGS